MKLMKSEIERLKSTEKKNKKLWIKTFQFETLFTCFGIVIDLIVDDRTFYCAYSELEVSKTPKNHQNR